MTRTLVFAFVSIFLGISLGLAVPAAAQKGSDGAAAAAQLKKAKAHFDLQEYDQAEQALKEAYRLDPKPQTLYAIAQAQRMGGACDRAIVTYRNYLRTKPKKDLAQSANENIARCEALLASAQEPEPERVEPPKEQPPPPVETPIEPTHAVDPADRALLTKSEPVETPSGVPWTKNWAAHLLLIGGVALAGGGTFLALDGDKTIQDINAARFYDDFVMRREELDAARSRRTLGYIAAGAGGAMLVGAIALYIIRSPDGEAARSTRITIDQRGTVQLAWGF